MSDEKIINDGKIDAKEAELRVVFALSPIIDAAGREVVGNILLTLAKTLTQQKRPRR